MKGINLVVIPFHDWKKCEREGFRTRDAHFMQEFGKHPSVDKLLIIDRTISISEMALYRRNVKVKNGELLYKENGSILSRISDKVYILDIFIAEFFKSLIMRRNWTSYIFGHRKVFQSVVTSLEYLGIEDNYSLFISEPLFVPLVRKLKPKIFVFDAQDNLLKHAMYKTVKGLKENYDYCLKTADLIYTNSKETLKWFEQIRPDAVHIPNGVDVKIFDNSRTYPISQDMQDITSPIIGYAGKMQEMFDIKLVESAIQELSEINFVFIGQILNPKWTEKLWRYPNVYYLGDKHYQLLPNYLASFDICIIPYHTTRQHNVDPIKFYEYLAMGKPIVTTRVGNTVKFNNYPQVIVANTVSEFIDGLNYFIKQIKTNCEIEIKPVPDVCLWNTKAGKIIQDIIQKSRQ